MEIINISLSRLRNEEHNQFHTDFSDLVIDFTPAALGIETQFSDFTRLLGNEKETLHILQKSDITDELVDSDALQDSTFRGFADSIKSSCNHFRKETRKAAIRVQIVFDEFGNIAEKSYDQETTAINNLVSKLKQDYAAEISILGVSEWIDELLANNKAFNTLIKNRYSQESAKTQMLMKRVRIDVDHAFRTITKRINALIIVNGEAAYEKFVIESNNRIENYTNNLAIRLGHNEKKTEDVVREK